MAKNALKATPVAELTAGINHHHRHVVAAGESMLAHAVAAGRLLLEAKSRAEFGTWQKWIEKHCEFGQTTAKKYVKLAGAYPRLPAPPLPAISGPAEKTKSPPSGGKSGTALPKVPPKEGLPPASGKRPKVPELSIREALGKLAAKDKPKPKSKPEPSEAPAGKSRLSNAAATEDMGHHDDPAWLHGTKAELKAKLREELKAMFTHLARVDKLFDRLGVRGAVEGEIAAALKAHDTMKAVANGLKG